MKHSLSRNYIAIVALGFCSLLYSAAGATADDKAPQQAPEANSQSQSLFDGKTLDGWKIADRGDFAEHGEVTVVDGEIHISAGNSGSGIAWQRKHPKIDYEVHLQAKRTDGRDFFCGMTFPVGDQNCTWIVGGWGGGVIGLSNINGASAVENSTTKFKRFENGRWYNLRLQVKADSIRAWIDDEKIIDVDSAGLEFRIWPNQSPMLPLGIATWDTSAALKDIRITPVSHDDTDDDETDDEDQ